MKKKFISVLTALMVLSMSTTVFGASSPSTGTIDPAVSEKVTVASDATAAVTEVTGAVADVATAEEVTDVAYKTAAVVGDGYKAEVKAVINLTQAGTPDANGNYNITLTIPSIKAGTDVFVLHIHDDGTYETLTATVADGKVSFSVKNFSTFAIVERVQAASNETTNVTNTTNTTNVTNVTNVTNTTVTSPKTGEAASIMPLMAAICLAGVVVCARRVKFN